MSEQEQTGLTQPGKSLFERLAEKADELEKEWEEGAEHIALKADELQSKLFEMLHATDTSDNETAKKIAAKAEEIAKRFEQIAQKAAERADEIMKKAEEKA